MEDTLVSSMDPQAFLRLSVGSLGLRIPLTASKTTRSTVRSSSSLCLCEIRLRGFPVQTAPIPLISSPGGNPDPHSNPTVFYLGESDLKALLSSRCFQGPQAYLEITVYMGRQGSHCGVTSKKQQIGTFRVEVGPEWGVGKPALLHDGWIGIGRNRQEAGKPGPELHLRVKLDLDPRYVFQFEDETALSPQIVQIQGSIKHPIFSCKFIQDRRVSQLDLMGSYWPNQDDPNQESERRDRKGWKVMIHDLSGSAVAAAFMATPFVPSNGCDRVARSNPGAWLIVRMDPTGSSQSWHPWGRLEAWRETRDSDCLRLHLLPAGQEAEVLVSEIMINTDKGGEFFIDMDRNHRAIPGGSQGDVGELEGVTSRGPVDGGFVMSCRVQGEGKRSKPLVQLAMRHVTCVEDAALFMALAAAVDLSVEACKPFVRKVKKGIRHSFLS